MDRLIVVAAQLLLLILWPGAQRYFNIARSILAAHHEADLARRVGGNGGVRVFDRGEHFLA